MVQGSGRRAVGVTGLLSVLLLIISAIDLAPAIADSGSGGSESSLTPAERELAATVPYSNRPLDNRSGDFDTRFAVPPHLDWREIYEKPQILSLSIDPVPGPGAREDSIGDVQGVFPVEARFYFAALNEFSSYTRVSPRTVYDVGRGSSGGAAAYHKRIQKIAARFLGFGDSYLFVTNNYSERLGKGTYGLKWNLERSLDGKFFALRGSWYVKEMDCGGTPCSYVRYFNRTGFVKRPPVPTSILSMVTGASFRNLLVVFYHEAVELQKKAGVSNSSPNHLLTHR